MSGARVFISHSATDTGWGKQLRECLAAELKNKNYEVFLDNFSLQPGDLWRPEIYRALTECDAAVLMLTPEALQSKWVLTECIYLAVRRDLNKHFERDFTLLPVLLNGLTGADLRASPPKDGRLPFDHLRLDDSQSVKPEAPDQTISPAIVAADIASRFPQCRVRDDAMAIWIKNIAAWLKKVDDTWIHQAAQILDVPAEDWFTREPRVFLATALLYGEFSNVQRALWTLMESGATTGRRILDATVPAGLPYETASKVIGALRYPPGQRAIAVNAAYPETAKRLVQRATCCDSKFLISDVPSSWDLEDAYQEVLQAVARHYGARPGPVDGPQLGEQIAAENFRSTFQIVVLLKRGADGMTGTVLAALLERLRAELPSVLFVVADGGVGAEDSEPALAGLLRAEPGLQDGEEEDIDTVVRRIENRWFSGDIGRSA